MKNTLLALLLTVPMGLAAQTAEIMPGRRIRVELADSSITGTYSSRTADSLVLMGKAFARLAVPVREVKGIRMSEGKSHLRGAAKGAGWGALVAGGSILMFATAHMEPVGGLIYGAAAAIPGALYGGIIGGIIGSEKWTTVQPAMPRVTVGAAPSGATRVGLSFSF
jgi:hypothetical protein